MRTTPAHPSDVRQRIVETAERLFYGEGMRAVGIDRIIAQAGVAKMSLYNHFASKDDLILAVLQYREEKFNSLLATWMKRHMKTKRDRLDAFFAALKDWFESPDFRGCMFINACVELADAKHPASAFSCAHKQRFHEMLRAVIAESRGAKAAQATAPAIALLVEGAIVTAMLEQSSRPAVVAKNAAAAFIAQTTRN